MKRCSINPFRSGNRNVKLQKTGGLFHGQSGPFMEKNLAKTKKNLQGELWSEVKSVRLIINGKSFCLPRHCNYLGCVFINRLTAVLYFYVKIDARHFGKEIINRLFI
jgi:hypothetical protein